MLRHFGGVHPVRGTSDIIQYTADTAFTPIPVNTSGSKTAYNSDSWNVIGTGTINGKFDTALVKIKKFISPVTISTSDQYLRNRIKIMLEATVNGDFLISLYDPNGSGTKYPALKFIFDKTAGSYDVYNKDEFQESELDHVKYTFIMDPVVTGTNNSRLVPILFRRTDIGYVNSSSLELSVPNGNGFTFQTTAAYGTAGSNSNTDFNGYDYGFYLLKETDFSNTVTDTINQIEDKMKIIDKQIEDITEDINKFSSESANYFVSR